MSRFTGLLFTLCQILILLAIISGGPVRGIFWLFHSVSLGVRLQSRKARFSGLVTEGGQNKPQIWNPRPQFTYSLYNFYRATMTVKGTLLLNNSIVKR